MKKIHVEFDLIVTDRSAEDLFDAFETSLKDNILDALELHDECEYILNFKMN